MCGICGFVGFEDKALLKRMCDSLRHRGPDDSGVYIDANVSFGHRRLAVIDIETGHQPIHNEDESVWITYNGEVFNYKELRAELEKSGHRFYTKSDTETIIHAYEEYGADCVKKFNGQFAFAIWDANREKLFLARDRLGIKPLYYAEINGNFLFASEIKAILEYGGYKREVDFNAMHNFIVFRYVNGIQTIFKGIKKVPPAHTMWVTKEGVQSSRYYTISINEKIASESYYSEKLFNILSDSIRKQLISDVPIGAYLSGGVDSSTVVGFMTRLCKGGVKTFSVGFEHGLTDPLFEDELKHARIIADYFGTDHTEIIVKHDSIKLLPEIIWHLDEPMSDLAVVPVYVMSKKAKRKVTVILTGEGGDEIWAGYPEYRRYLNFYRINRLFDFIPRPIRADLYNLAEDIPPSKLRRAVCYNLDMRKSYADLAGVFGENIEDIYTDRTLEKITVKNPRRQIITPYVKKKCHFLNQMLISDTENLLSNSYLIKVDRMTMAHGVEARVPLLDHDIVDFAFNLPPEMKLNKNIDKYLLRKTAIRAIPKKTAERPKRGFSVPVNQWIKELPGLVDNILKDKALVDRGYFKVKLVQKLLAKSRNPTPSIAQKLWSIIILELWHRMFIDQEPVRNIRLY